MAKKRRGPLNTISPNNVVTNPLLAKSSRNIIWFDFQSNNWMKSVKIDGFTNFFNGPNEHSKHFFYILYTLIPTIIRDWEIIVRRSGGYRHCHLVTGNERKLVHKIYGDIHGYELAEELNIWQLGLTGSVRLFCLYNDSEKALVPIFVDHHHLIFSSIKHNQRDYESSSFCPVCEYNT